MEVETTNPAENVALGERPRGVLERTRLDLEGSRRRVREGGVLAQYDTPEAILAAPTSCACSRPRATSSCWPTRR